MGGGEGPSEEEKIKMVIWLTLSTLHFSKTIFNKYSLLIKTFKQQEQLERERLDALREAEERRTEKHRKLEEEREGMRKGIRDKVRLTYQ